MNKAVFLDRDGVINELVYHQEQEVIDSPFTVRQFKLIHGVPEFIKSIQQSGYKVIVVSNQPGIAKGQMSAETFRKIRERMRTKLVEAGVKLDGEYYCLHHPEATVAKYRVDCDCRKPKPGLLLKAAQDLNIDLQHSWMVGDNISDVKAGKDAGCHTILISKLKCELCNIMAERNIKPDIISEDISQAFDVILGNSQSQLIK